MSGLLRVTTGLFLVPASLAVVFGQGWREAAEARIERIRKAEFVVRVEDSGGKPAPGVPVRIRMVRHAFGWGTAVAARQLLGAGEDADRYRRALLENFNMAVLENDLKWPQWEQNRTAALDALKWLHANGISRVRGHTLVWPGWRWLPKDIKELAGDPAALRKRVLDHIRDEVSATRGLLEDWDVVNEPYTNHDLMDIVGREEMVAWYQAAREYDPKPTLFLNDFNIIEAGGRDAAHQEHFYGTIRFLLDRGAPLGGIGIQGHFREPTPPEKILEILDRFAEFNLPIRITEFDFDTQDEQLQADFTRDFLTAIFSHPRVDALLMWGFWEARHWRPAGAMLRKDWSEKPNYRVWRELVHGRWRTETEAATGQDGVVQTRAFRGEYEIRAGGKTVQASCPGVVRIRLD
jgi:GH35 family endo-1,4-beta-xylanase